MNADEITNDAFPSEALASTRDPSPLLMDADTFYHLGMHAVELAADYLEALPDKPVYRPMMPSERQILLYQPLPVYGRSPEALFDFFEQHILPHAMGNQHPRFAAWVNPAGAPIGMLAEFLAAVMNPSAAGGDHAAIYLEHCVVRWLMELIDFPTEGSAGLLVGGGSVASLYCLAVARHWAAARNGWNVREEGLQGKHPRLVLYVSEEGHSCLRKASHLLGLGEPSRVSVDTSFKMNLSALRDAVERDRAKGLLPFCVAASAGTVNTGAVDPLDDLADFCREQGLWLHVDGAHGASALLSSNPPRALNGLRSLERHPSFGDARGLGLVAGLEIVLDKKTRAVTNPPTQLGLALRAIARRHGLISLNIHPGNVHFFTPPLIIEHGDIDQMIDILDRSLTELEAQFDIR